ncbi:MAG TPA: mechanosensitive ion channel family protein [Gammaproteobacteria bacterium]|nr:mechanosensitive ion channel family protein [Gammaproteobacteria bacterium]
MTPCLPLHRPPGYRSLPSGRSQLRLFVLLCFLCCGLPARAETPAGPPGQTAQAGAPSSASITRELDRIEHELKSTTPTLEQLERFLGTLTRANSWSQNCATEQQQALKKEEQLLAAVGKPVPSEPADVTRQRRRLIEEKHHIEKQLAVCRVIEQRSQQLAATVSSIRKGLQSRLLLARGPNLLELLADTVSNPGVWLQATRQFITDTSGLADIDQADVVLFILATALAVALGTYIRIYAARRLEHSGEPTGPNARFFLALLMTVRRYAVALLATGTAAALLYLHGRNQAGVPFINILAYGLPLVVGLTALINLSINALPGGMPSAQGPESFARRLSRRLKTLVVLIFIGYLLFATILAQSLPTTVFLLARLVYGAFLVVNLIWILWLIGSTTQSRLRLLLRILASTLLIVSLVSAALGYHNLADYIFKFVVGTILVLGVYFSLSALVRVQLDALDEGKEGWTRPLRSLLGLKPGQPFTGILWIRLLFTLTLWAGLFYGLMKVWQIPQAAIESFTTHVTRGFTIGSYLIKPLSIAEALLALAVLLTFNSWFRKWLEQEWLTQTRMDRGARESVATISGYVGILISFVIALNIAGMNFSKLAIIAGALSVGIGFGLQNIVNNFISGLILLFERPVKTGDWIIVGEVEGYVKRISIRTTQIMTFDRADVIIPNTELISGNVTNMMLHDPRGRLRIPIGVAYGTDTAKVRELLLQVANEHPEVMGEGYGVIAPYVLFREFGDSSLNFELRCFIADIDRRLRVISDLNFAIDEIFREHGIEIPFPQRDIHIRDGGRDSSDDPTDKAKQDEGDTAA